jgi:hypothetical protein
MQTMQELEISLPSTEYKVTFSDETVTLLSVHPNESLEESLTEMLQASGKAAEAVSSIELLQTFNLEEEHSELFE